ncbi:unnamed protein product, partial [Closterium sp. NIES-53]
MYDAIVAHYSTPSFPALSRLLVPSVFPDMGSFRTVSDLDSHLRSLDTSFRAACTQEQLKLVPASMKLTLHWLVTRLPDRLCSARDALLRKHHAELTIDLLKSNLLVGGGGGGGSGGEGGGSGGTSASSGGGTSGGTGPVGPIRGGVGPQDCVFRS